ANRLIEAGKGQRKKPRFGEWQLWQEAIAVDTYAASEIPAQEVPKPGLREQELQRIYRAALHKISTSRGNYTDKERQAMADAVKEFHNRLKEAIHAKTAH